MLDNRKHAIRSLWRRNGKFVARITVEGDAGRKKVKWLTLEAATAAAAQEEFRTLLVERGEDRLRHIGLCPKFSDYVAKTYEQRLATAGKKPGTLVTEHVHLKQNPGGCADAGRTGGTRTRLPRFAGMRLGQAFFIHWLMVKFARLSPIIRLVP